MIENEHTNIPRLEIPWFPTIDERLCSNCGICVEFCAKGVYLYEDKHTHVIAPYNCVVGCSGCESLCSLGAIRFPDMGEFMLKLHELRAQYEG
jgi:NAD-dependent dihydropyrimidine dehydrogenase PreA subunit